MSLLLAGGPADPNLHALVQAAEHLHVEVIDVRAGPDAVPAFLWEFGGPLRVGGVEIQPRGAFLRHDVFGPMETPTPEVANIAYGWYASVMGWLLSREEVRTFNRHIGHMASLKPAALHLAKQIGLRIPETRVTNDVATLSGLPPEETVAKPVNGGGYCLKLSKAMTLTEARDGVVAIPALVQECLVAPEIRVYIMGPHEFAFEMRSESLDYREKQDVQVIPVEPPPKETALLRTLMETMGMDYGAADFKTHPKTGELVFLELNTSPMIARFDYESGGKLAQAMVSYLVS